MEQRRAFTLEGSPVGFWNSLEIWIKKPHVLNRRLCGTAIQCSASYVHGGTWDLAQFVRNNATKTKNFFCEKLASGANVGSHDVHEDFIKMYLQLENMSHSGGSDFVPINFHDTTSFLDNGVPATEMRIICRTLLPKQTDRCPELVELIIYDGVQQQVLFMPVCSTFSGSEKFVVSNDLMYSLALSSKDVSVELVIFGDDKELPNVTAGCTSSWLQEQLLPKVCKWSCQDELNTDGTSLKLLSVQKYNACYQYLKQKYGIPLVQKWPESTDPQKFVFEDIAITAYLMVLWEEERERTGRMEKQSFVDLGCGNGLLVYLLQSEGYKGLGLDLKRRKIWDMFGDSANLQEAVVTPSDQHRFPDYDWLIGNHSDELTPWIPVIAARSSYNCRFFVLPCCPWDFDKKFSSKQKGQSVYGSYLEYVKLITETCGFTVQEDNLRIPSTKRTCIIGGARNYSLDEEDTVNLQRQSFINSRCKMSVSTDQQDLAEGHHWINSFQAREPQPAKNCANVDLEVKHEIYGKVFSAVLNASDGVTKTLNDGRSWQAGGSVALPDLVKLLTKSELEQLKSECGGLQTLLKNSSHIFRVQNGKVQLRQWDDNDECWRVRQRMKKKGKQKPDSSQLVKTKLCWFHTNHPDGCPRTLDQCYFAHGEEDLRTLDQGS